MENTQTNSGQSAAKVVILIIVAALIVGGLFWYAKYYKKAAPAGVQITPATTLGGQLYNQANNPIQNKLPDTVTPVPNPIQGTYKNPFQ